MCYECGCMKPDLIVSDDSITEETFEKAAEGAHITVEGAKRNTLALLLKELGETPESARRSSPDDEDFDYR